MTTTEDRLIDALRGVSETLGPEDVPALRPASRRRLGVPVAVALAVAATVAAVGLVFVPDDDCRDAAAPATTEVVVYLCTRTSGGHCRNKVVTPQQKQAIKDALQKEPAVSEVRYESLGEAFQRSKSEGNRQGFIPPGGEGDIRDSFWVVLKSPGAAPQLVEAFKGRPGVDRATVAKRPEARRS